MPQSYEDLRKQEMGVRAEMYAQSVIIGLVLDAVAGRVQDWRVHVAQMREDAQSISETFELLGIDAVEAMGIRAQMQMRLTQLFDGYHEALAIFEETGERRFGI
jgi:hypothetical protein